MMLSSWLMRRQSSKASSLCTSTRPSYSFGKKSAVCLSWRMLRTPGMSCPSTRVDAEHLHVGALLLEESSGPGDRAAGAEAGDEMGDLPRRLAPDLRARRAVVGLGIRRVLVLVQVVVAGALAELGGERDGPLGGAGGGAQVVLELDELGAEEAQRRALLGGDLVRERRGEAVALGVRDHREPHARCCPTSARRAGYAAAAARAPRRRARGWPRPGPSPRRTGCTTRASRTPWRA